jgi:Domain of unknown function (DUF4351)
MTTPLDSPWKDILESYFPQFMAFFFPDAYSQIDWSRGFTFLDGELQQITRESETGRLYVDKLVRVYLLDGSEHWVVIHVEVQSQKEDNFGQRVFTYFARLQDKFQRPVASLVILGDTDKDWLPSSHGSELFGCRLQFTFPIVKLVEYKKRTAELEASDNPFSVVVLAHIAAQATKDSRSQLRRRKRKFTITKMLYERGYSIEEVNDIFRFIDWVLTLPIELEESFKNELIAYEDQKNMPYITSIERSGIAQGLAKGNQNMKDMLFNLLQKKLKLGELPIDLRNQVQELSVEQIQALGVDLLDFSAIDDLVVWLSIQK